MKTSLSFHESFSAKKILFRNTAPKGLSALGFAKEIKLKVCFIKPPAIPHPIKIRGSPVDTPSKLR
jgi:hypothetical protein